MSIETWAETFVEFADTRVEPFDVSDFLHLVTVRCTELLGVAATGVLLSDDRGNLEVAAASTDEAEVLELLQLLTGEGPCPECFRTGEPVGVPDLTAPAATGRWPRLTREAAQLGYPSVHALPMRLRGEVIGALDLFEACRGPLTDSTLRLGQALADIATIGLLRQRAVRQHYLVAGKVRRAVELLRRGDREDGVLGFASADRGEGR